MQQVKAGLKAIYLSGWQVAADANIAGQMYPDQSLYPANSVPQVVKRINQTLQRADQISFSEGNTDIDWFAPIVADAEAGFGGALNVFELMKSMIEAGASGVHFEDQLSSEKKCGHLGGKVLLPTQTAIRNLVSARLAADVMGTPTILIARTDADAADLITVTLILLMHHLSQENVHQKDSTVLKLVLNKRLHAVFHTRHMLILFGVKHLNQILKMLANLQRLFMRNSLVNCWLIIVHLRLTGKQN